MFICKLIKWTALTGVAATATGFVLFGTHAPSYVGTMFGSMREKVRGQIPVEFELERARKLIQAIDPEIEDCKRDVARAEVEMESLDEEVRRLERDTAKAQKKVQGHRELIKDNQGNAFTINGVVYRRREIMLDLERTFDAVRQNEGLLVAKKTLIENQGKAVAAARTRLDAVRNEKARLEDMVGTLTTQKRKMDTLAVQSLKFTLDTSNLSHAKEVLNDVKRRLDVAQRMIQADLAFVRSDGPEEVHPRPGLVGEVDAYLDGEKAEAPAQPAAGK